MPEPARRAEATAVRGSVSRCQLCSQPGRVLHRSLSDRFGQAPGSWTLVTCSDPDCGIAWLQPAPDEEVLASAYRGYYTHRGDDRAGALRRVNNALTGAHLRRRFGYEIGPRLGSIPLALLALAHPGGSAELDYKVMYLPKPQPGARLLDVGFGSGQFLLRMQNLGWAVTGVDTDSAAVEAAASSGLEVRRGHIRPGLFGDSTFDAVCLSHSIEHVPDPLETLRECQRLLKMGGVLVIATPNLDSWGHRRFGASWIHLDPPRHQHLFRMTGLVRAIRQCGFKVERAFTTARTARFVWSASRAVSRTGRADVAGPSARRELAGIPFQILQRLLLIRRPTAGEDLVVVARRA